MTDFLIGTGKVLLVCAQVAFWAVVAAFMVIVADTPHDLAVAIKGLVNG